MRALVPWLLVACAESGTQLPDPAPPPGVLTLQALDPFVSGQPTRLRVSGADANRPVYLLASAASGPGACPAPLAPTCLDIASPFRILDAVTADAAGRAQFRPRFPASAEGLTLSLQGVQPSITSTSNVVSDVVAAPVDPCLSTVTFQGSIVTVVDTPFGFDSATLRLSPVSGSMTFDICLLDIDGRADVGEYDHATSQTSAFDLTIAWTGTEITGSGRAIIEVQDFGSDVFRFTDGPQFIDPTDRTMFVDGVADPNVELWISIVDGTGAALTGDDPPIVFPFDDMTQYPHTFSLEDDAGTALVQLTSMTQTVVPVAP